MPSANIVPMPAPKKKRKPSMRVRGQGTLFLRGQIYWMELNWKGVRYRKSLETPDRQTALMKLDAEVAGIRSGELPKTFPPITVQAMYESWMTDCENHCKPRTLDDYQRRWNKHLKPTFGNLVATQVDLFEISRYLNKRMKQGAGLISRNREQQILMGIFNFNRSKIPADRFPQFPKRQSERGHVRTGRLSKADYKTLVERLDNPRWFFLKAFLVLTFKYGFRYRELLHAKGGYFDPVASTITLPPYATKNNLPRVVDIARDGEVFQMLVKLVGKRPADAPLFVRQNGKPVLNFRRYWEKQVADFKGGSGKGGRITIHDLRRSAITNMSEKRVTAVQAGTHLTDSIFRRYIQRDPSERQATAAIIEAE